MGKFKNYKFMYATEKEHEILRNSFIRADSLEDASKAIRRLNDRIEEKMVYAFIQVLGGEETEVQAAE